VASPILYAHFERRLAQRITDGASTPHYAEILQRKLTAAYRKADYFARNLRTIQVLIDRDTILPGAAAGSG
jgi:hypothetical protein